MDDHKLLEMASRASGISIRFFNISGDPVIALEGGGPESCLVRIWNPLIDDGDALRLVIALKMDLMFFRGFEEVCVQGEGAVDTPSDLGESIEVNEKFGEDMSAVTRRAIVRAAAEIGKAMS